MSFLNMRFGVPRDSELMATVQECSNWGLAPLSGQTRTLLNLSSEENNTFIGWLGVYRETAHLFTFLWVLSLSDWISVWLDGLRLHCFLLEKMRVKLTVRRSVSWPIGSVIHITKRSTICWLHCVAKWLLSFCLFCTCSSLVIVHCDPGDECNRWTSMWPIRAGTTKGPRTMRVPQNTPSHHTLADRFEELQATLWVNLLLPCGL